MALLLVLMFVLDLCSLLRNTIDRTILPVFGNAQTMAVATGTDLYLDGHDCCPPRCALIH